MHVLCMYEHYWIYHYEYMRSKGFSVLWRYSHVMKFFQILKDERKFLAYSIFLLHPIQALSCSISLHFSLFCNYFFFLLFAFIYRQSISTIFDFSIRSRYALKIFIESRGISLSSPRDKTLNQARLKARVS